MKYGVRSLLQTETLLVLAFSGVNCSLDCRKMNTCACQMTDGSGVIDLSSEGRFDGQPLFTNVAYKAKNLLFSYNPCHGFTDIASKGVCKQVALCMEQTVQDSYLALGTQEQSDFKYNHTRSQIYIAYKNPIQENITSHVYLKCGGTEGFEILQVADNWYEMQYSSPCACPDHCVQRLSPGSIVLIIFFSFTITYFFVGMLYNKTVHNSSGKELIPHQQFWESLPGLIKDGYWFFISPCVGDRVEYVYYERL